MLGRKIKNFNEVILRTVRKHQYAINCNKTDSTKNYRKFSRHDDAINQTREW